MTVSIIIPARLQSTRLQEKLLLKLQNKPIIQWVYESCKKVNKRVEVFIATDHEKIAKVCKGFGAQVILTDSNHRSGTDRCAEVANQLTSELVINVQGDEPFIDPEHIQKMIHFFETNSSTNILTLYHRIEDNSLLRDPSNVKLIKNKWGKILYFSRSEIPYPRNAINTDYYQHIGIYAFKRKTLLEIAQLKPSKLELTEGLEQLRWLENGYDIYGLEVDKTNLSIDTPEDYEKAKRLAAQYSK